MIRALGLVLVLGATPALAQVRAPSGDPDLDKAVAMCDANRSVALVRPPATPSPWQPGYSACSQVMARWNAAVQAKIASDQSWLESFAKGTGK